MRVACELLAHLVSWGHGVAAPLPVGKCGQPASQFLPTLKERSLAAAATEAVAAVSFPSPPGQKWVSVGRGKDEQIPQVTLNGVARLACPAKGRSQCQ